MSINGTEIQVVIDSGSGVTIIAEALVKKLNLGRQESEGDHIVTASGQQVPTKGKITGLPVVMDSMEFTVNALILPVKGYQLLLGNDILGSLKMHIDFENHRLWVKGRDGRSHQVAFKAGSTAPKEKPVERKENTPPKQASNPPPRDAFRLVSRDSIRVPPWHQAMLPIEVQGKPSREGTYLIKPAESVVKRYGIIAAAGVVDMTNLPKQILVTNMSKHTYTIPPKQQIAFLSPISAPNSHESFLTENFSDALPPSVLPEIETNPQWNCDQINVQHRPKVKALLDKYYDKLCGTKDRHIGQYKYGETSIPTEPGARPISIQPRRLAPAQEKFVKEELEKYLSLGFISPSTSSWASPIVVVKKKDGGYRLCVDYRKLNETIVKDVYPMPRTDGSPHAIHGAKFFSVMDLKSGYHQLPLKSEDKKKTAFSTKFGLFEFNTLPFGLTNAPAAFQRMMDAILHGLKWESCLCIFGRYYRIFPDIQPTP